MLSKLYPPHHEGCIFTLCNLKYLPQALVAVNTYSKYNSVNHKYIILVDGDEILELEGVTILTVQVILDGTIDYSLNQINAILDHYTVTSLCTALKPLALLYFRLLITDTKYFIYVDPDTYWLGPLDVHLFPDQINFFRHRNFLCDDSGYSGRNFLTYGGVNLGIMVDTGAPIDLIASWYKFALPINFESAMLGFYTDQKPADLLVLSGCARILYDDRVNLSYWNILDVRLIINDHFFYINQVEESKLLIMFHFSGYKNDINLYHGDRKYNYENTNSKIAVNSIHKLYSTQVENVINMLKCISIKTNLLGSADNFHIFRYLINIKYYRVGILNNIMRYIISIDFIAKIICKFYMIKNPFKI